MWKLSGDSCHHLLNPLAHHIRAALPRHVHALLQWLITTMLIWHLVAEIDSDAVLLTLIVPHHDAGDVRVVEIHPSVMLLLVLPLLLLVLPLLIPLAPLALLLVLLALPATTGGWFIVITRDGLFFHNSW